MSLFLQLTMDATLPNEMHALRELVSTLQTTLAAVQAENKLLRQKLDALALPLHYPQDA